MTKIYQLFAIGICLTLSAFSQPDATTYYKTGISNLNNREYIDAIGAFTNAISLNPGYADAYYYRAYAKDLLGKKMGFTSTELCTDLVAALKLGNPQAGEKIEKSCFGECFNIQSAFLEPELVYCADFSSSTLTDLPAGSEKLQYLVRLNFFNNKATSLSPTFTNFVSLVSLDVSSNELKSLPPSFGKLEHLKELNLNKNQLTELPAEFGNLKQLKTLTFRQNKLSTLPRSIAQLTSLENLDLAFNQITTLPMEVANLKKLKTLTLVGNPISEDKYKKEREKLQQLLPKTTIYYE